MELDGLKFRWIYGACYEMILPGGKSLIVDPWIQPHHFEEMNWDDVQGADYILISHTHYDHITDVGYLAKKYDSKVIIGAMSAMEIARLFDISYNNMYPVYPQEDLSFDDLDIHAMWGKHSYIIKEHAHLSTPSLMQPKFKDDFGTCYDYCNHVGTIEMVNYMLTFSNNMRLFFSSGGLEEIKTGWKAVEEFRPNVVIRHLLKNMSAKEFAEYCARTKAQLVLPHHHENFAKIGVNVDEYINEVNSYLKEMGSVTRVFNPELFKWYHVTMGLS